MSSAEKARRASPPTMAAARAVLAEFGSLLDAARMRAAAAKQARWDAVVQIKASVASIDDPDELADCLRKWNNELGRLDAAVARRGGRSRRLGGPDTERARSIVHSCQSREPRRTCVVAAYIRTNSVVILVAIHRLIESDRVESVIESRGNTSILIGGRRARVRYQTASYSRTT